jgi:hypothetical protein
VRVSVAFVAAAALSAALLFGLEPLIVKMALPTFGGAPTVWNVSFGFFTIVLLLGYVYAHALARLPLRRQVTIHAAVVIVAAAFLPPRPAPAELGALPPAAALFALLFERIGLPFFALSASAPLLQAWFSRAQTARDPYRLYAASNAGSIVALLAYPFLVEPFLGLHAQSAWWAALYALFLLALAQCAAAAWRGASADPAAPAAAAAPTPRETPRERALWTLLAAVPVVLMLGLTSVLTSEVASLPFVWTMPLAAYLLAYVVAFSGLPWRPLIVVAPLATVPVVVLATVHASLDALPFLALSMLAFFLLALGCIGRLADARPAPQRLTSFYLYVALGGAIGGAFAAFVAPLAFDSIVEYPLAIVLSLLLLPYGAKQSGKPALAWLRDAAIAVAIVAATGLLTRFAALDESSDRVTALLWVALAAGLCAAFARRRALFALCVAGLFLYGNLLAEPVGFVIARQRDFYSTSRVIQSPGERFHVLISGATVHGVEELYSGRAAEPLAYYTRSGPLGDIFKATAARFAGRNVAAVGLGIGSAACLRSRGQHWTFYELDPQVERVAHDAKLFSVLDTCAPDARVVIGDARRSLGAEVGPSYALIVLDAYDSDQVPVHLLTREALAVYLRRLDADGLLAFHTSNRHFELAPVLAALAADAGLTALERDDEALTVDEAQSGKLPSSWVLMARRGSMPEALLHDPRWRDLERADIPLWTDDYSSLARILRTHGR